MKKILLALGIAAMLIVVLHGCKKESTDFQDEKSNLQVNESKMIVGKIDSFREKMNSQLKSGGSMTVDSAVWNLEALLNYDYAIPDSASRDYTLINSYYTLPVDENGMVSDLDLQTAFSHMTDTVDYQLSQIVSENKFLVLADIELVRVENHVAYITAHLGYGYNFIYGMYWPFTADDDWIWGTIYTELVGKCDGTEIGVSDGSNEIQWRLNNPVIQPSPSTYTNLETIEVNFTNCWYNEPPQLPRVFSSYDGNYCLQNEELTHLVMHADWIIYDYNDPSNDWGSPPYVTVVIEDGEGARPQGKDFISIEIDDMFRYADSKFFHNYYITYGIRTGQIPD